MTKPKIHTGTLIGPEGERVGRYVAYEDVAHLLQDEPPAPQICHWRGCTWPMAPGDSYLCADHRSALNRTRELHNIENRCVHCHEFRQSGATSCGNCGLKF